MTSLDSFRDMHLASYLLPNPISFKNYYKWRVTTYYLSDISVQSNLHIIIEVYLLYEDFTVHSYLLYKQYVQYIYSYFIRYGIQLIYFRLKNLIVTTFLFNGVLLSDLFPFESLVGTQPPIILFLWENLICFIEAFSRMCCNGKQCLNAFTCF